MKEPKSDDPPFIVTGIYYKKVANLLKLLISTSNYRVLYFVCSYYQYHTRSQIQPTIPHVRHKQPKTFPTCPPEQPQTQEMSHRLNYASTKLSSVAQRSKAWVPPGSRTIFFMFSFVLSQSTPCQQASVIRRTPHGHYHQFASVTICINSDKL